MQANLNRLTDLTAELRRQLKPLGRQAEVARRAAVIQADLRDARLRLLADDLVTLRATLRQGDRRRDRAAGAPRGRSRRELDDGAGRVRPSWRTAYADDAPLLAAGPGDLVPALRAAGAGAGSTAQLAAERLRHLSAHRRRSGPAATRRSWTPRPSGSASRRRSCEAALEATRSALAEAVAAPRRSWSGSSPAEERRWSRRQGDRRPARGAGQARPARSTPARSRVPPPPSEIDRLAAAHAEAQAPGRRGRRRSTTQLRGRGRPRPTRTTPTWPTPARRGGQPRTARGGGAPCARSSRAPNGPRRRTRAAWKAREEALALGPAPQGRRRRAAGRAGPAARPARQRRRAADGRAGVRGRAGRRARRARRRGRRRRPRRGRRGDAAAQDRRRRPGRPAGRRSGGPAPTTADALRPALPDGHGWAADLVDAPPTSCARPLRRAAARRGRRRRPRRRPARWSPRSPDAAGGDPRRRRARRVRRAGGSAKAPSCIEVQAAVDEAARPSWPRPSRTVRASCATELAARATRRRTQAARRGRWATRAPRRPSGEAQRRVAQQLGRARRAAAAAAGRGRAARGRRPTAPRRRCEQRPGAAGRAGGAARRWPRRPRSTRSRPPRSGTGSPPTVPQARQNEMEVRLAVRTAEERVGALAGRADALAAAGRRRARRARARGRARRARPARHGRGDRRGRRGRRPAGCSTHVAVSLARGRAGTRRRRARPRPAASEELSCRAVRGAASAHGRAGRLTARCTATRWPAPSSGCGSSSWRPRPPRSSAGRRQTLIAEYGPGSARAAVTARRGRGAAGGPGAPAQPSRCRSTAPSRRSGLQGRRAGADQLLGKVNPLALEEFAALEERHQVPLRPAGGPQGDPRATCSPWSRTSTSASRGLHRGVPRTPPASSRRSSRVLFPGGEGRLVLTDPDDMLTTGRRGRGPAAGQEDQAAVAAVRRRAVADRRGDAGGDLPGPAQPVLHHGRGRGGARRRQPARLITLMEELREKLQLIVITHQKRTMEVADALYGVDHARDGVTKVISQRLREREPA